MQRCYDHDNTPCIRTGWALLLMMTLLIATPLCVGSVEHRDTCSQQHCRGRERGTAQLSPGPLAIPQLLSKEHIGPDAQMLMAT